MLIRYAHHARQRMLQRGISEADVRQCLEGYVSRFETRIKTEYKGVVRGRMLKVGVAPDMDTADEKFVKTVMWEGDDGT